MTEPGRGDDGSSVVEEWARQVLVSPRDLLLEERHVDELAPSHESDRSVETTLRLYETLLTETAGVASEIMAIAIFPLGYSRDLVLDPPDPTDLQSVVDPDEPPSLYLASRRFRQHARQGEEYRKYVPQDIVVPESGVVRAVYQVFRNEEAAHRGWEFARSLHFEHYTPDLAGSRNR